MGNFPFRLPGCPSPTDSEVKRNISPSGLSGGNPPFPCPLAKPLVCTYFFSSGMVLLVGCTLRICGENRFGRLLVPQVQGLSTHENKQRKRMFLLSTKTNTWLNNIDNVNKKIIIIVKNKRNKRVRTARGVKTAIGYYYNRHTITPLLLLLTATEAARSRTIRSTGTAAKCGKNDRARDGRYRAVKMRRNSAANSGATPAFNHSHRAPPSVVPTDATYRPNTDAACSTVTAHTCRRLILLLCVAVL